VCFELTSALDDKPATLVLKVVEYTIDISFWLDLMVNFLTGYQKNNLAQEIEFDIKKVALHYMKGFFLIDFVACLSSLVGTLAFGNNGECEFPSFVLIYIWFSS
jgi:hypothetical protein